MKKVKLSLIVALAILGASVTAFTGKTNVTPGWYGQEDDGGAPYDLTNPILSTQLNMQCPTSDEHICAVELNENGDLVGTRKSKNNFGQ